MRLVFSEECSKKRSFMEKMDERDKGQTRFPVAGEIIKNKITSKKRDPYADSILQFLRSEQLHQGVNTKAGFMSVF